MDLVFLYLFWSLSRVWSGREDGGNSITEIRLAKSRTNPIQRVLDKINRDRWHRDGFIKLILVVIALSFGTYGGQLLKMGILFLSILASQVVIFNPIVAKKISEENQSKYNFYYLSPEGWDGFFKRTIGEVAYYYIALIIFIGGFLLNFLEIV